jgi:hypothetical protein
LISEIGINMSPRPQKNILHCSLHERRGYE